MIVLDDSKPSEDPAGDGRSQTAVTAITSPSECLLDLDIEANQVAEDDSQSKPALLDHSLPDAQVLDRKFTFDFQKASLGRWSVRQGSNCLNFIKKSVKFDTLKMYKRLLVLDPGCLAQGHSGH